MEHIAQCARDAWLLCRHDDMLGAPGHRQGHGWQAYHSCSSKHCLRTCMFLEIVVQKETLAQQGLDATPCSHQGRHRLHGAVALPVASDHVLASHGAVLRLLRAGVNSATIGGAGSDVQCV